MSGPPTKYGGPRGDQPGRPRGILVGKARARRLKKEAAEIAAVSGPTPGFKGEPLELIEQVWRDEGQPWETRLRAIREYITLSAIVAKEAQEVGTKLEDLINSAHAVIERPAPKPTPEPPVEVLLIQAGIDSINRVIADADQRIRQFQFAGDTEKAAEVRRIKDEANAHHRKLLTARDRAYHAK
jgi:hypothetical protein